MKKGLIFGALGVMALAFASCSSDEPTGYQDEKVDRDQVRYISVALCNPTNYMSRDGEFEDGATSESAVNSLYFVFYDGSGAPVFSKSLSGAEVSTWTENLTENNVTRFWQSTIGIEMSQGQNKPVYVMCFVNPTSIAGLNTMNLSEIDALTRDKIYTEGAFAMSNSVYYGNNPITGQSNVRMMATPIVGDQLYSSAEEAEENPAVEIYVERYAAKVGLTMGQTAIATGYEVMVAGATPDATPTAGTIYFTPTYWRPNAVDETTYVTKGFSTTALRSDPTKPATYAALQDAFTGTGMAGQGLTGWNDAGNYRSYWACSPSYYADNYPQCSDNITDVTSAGDAYPYEVKYFTYNEISAATGNTRGIAWSTENGFQTVSAGANTSGYYYMPETTASIDKITATNINNKAVVASVVIVGNYRLNTATTNPTFYLYGKSGGKDVYYTDANIEQALISNQNVIFTDALGTTRATNINSYVVKHPDQAVRGTQSVPGRLVTLQIDEDYIKQAGNPALYFYVGADVEGANANGFTQITTANVTEANQLLWASASTAQKFFQGLAFFSIPIRHLGWDKNVATEKPLLSQPGGGRATMINWQNLRRGDLGVVRNHVYNIEVTGVTGLGIGLENADQPIVPPMDPDNYYISAKLNILAWRIVPTQSVVI